MVDELIHAETAKIVVEQLPEDVPTPSDHAIVSVSTEHVDDAENEAPSAHVTLEPAPITLDPFDDFNDFEEIHEPEEPQSALASKPKGTSSISKDELAEKHEPQMAKSPELAASDVPENIEDKVFIDLELILLAGKLDPEEPLASLTARQDGDTIEVLRETDPDDASTTVVNDDTPAVVIPKSVQQSSLLDAAISRPTGQPEKRKGL